MWTTEQIGQALILIGSIIAVAGVIIGALLSRKSSRENNEIQSFEAMTGAFNANMKALTDRVVAAEEKSSKAEEEVKELRREVEGLREERHKERGEYTRMRTVVQKWFKTLELAWEAHGVSDPMPMPEESDADWLGLERTIPSLRALKGS